MKPDRFDRCLDGLLPDDGAVLLAVSGGIDSMVMADLFLNSAVKRSMTLAHCDFHLRGEESDADAAFVEEWAKSRGIPFRRADFDTLEYASAHGISVEMAARELRYSWFAALCEKEGYTAVAVAHNANDNAETLFLNLLRGTGLKGICGMKAFSPLPGASSAVIVRPLLEFTRGEIREYALSGGLTWREDSSNADSSYKRNLIRNEVFPLLERVNPSFLDTLAADMRRFSEVSGLVDDYVESRLSSVAGTGQGDGRERLIVDVRKLLAEPHWEYLLYRLMEPFGFNEAAIGDMTALINGGSTFSGRVFLSKEYVASTSRDFITVGEPVGPQALRLAQGPGESRGPILVEKEGEYSLDGIRFVVDRIEIEDPRQPEGTTVVALDFPFTVRRWMAGDWMRPLGMKGRRKKLSDMFVDLKLTPERKEKALVIADEGSHVLALLGRRVDESVALPVPELVEGPAVRIRLI